MHTVTVLFPKNIQEYELTPLAIYIVKTKKKNEKKTTTTNNNTFHKFKTTFGNTKYFT